MDKAWKYQMPFNILVAVAIVTLGARQYDVIKDQRFNNRLFYAIGRNIQKLNQERTEKLECEACLKCKAELDKQEKENTDLQKEEKDDQDQKVVSKPSPVLPSKDSIQVGESRKIKQLKGKVIVYSPQTWVCEPCIRLKKELEERKATLPFEVVEEKKDGFSFYPHIEMTTPEGGKVYWVEGKNSRSIKEMLRVHKILWETPQKEEVVTGPLRITTSAMNTYDSAELRRRINTHKEWLPVSGTVVGKTVTQHLIDEHHFQSWQLTGLSEAEKHKLHQIAHNETDGRRTAVP